MKQKQQSITNEELSKFFDDHFLMTHYAINYAKDLIDSGRECSLSEVTEEIKKKLLLQSKQEE